MGDQFQVQGQRAGPAPEGDHYFDATERVERYGKSGRRLKRPRRVPVPGAPPDVVGIVDFTRSGNRWTIHFLKTREDRRQTGVAGALIDELYRQAEAAGVLLMDWGDIHHPGAAKLYLKHRDADRVRTRGRL